MIRSTERLNFLDGGGELFLVAGGGGDEAMLLAAQHLGRVLVVLAQVRPELGPRQHHVHVVLLRQCVEDVESHRLHARNATRTQ